MLCRHSVSSSTSHSQKICKFTLLGLPLGHLTMRKKLTTVTEYVNSLQLSQRDS